MSKFFRELDLSQYPVPEKPIPILILTGFLGSGKTTLLNHILHANHGLRIAVLVNDFGDINIDSQMVVDVEGENLISLENGCICCTIRGDLLDSVLGLFQRDPLPETIVIEASGVSYPAEIAKTFLLNPLEAYLQVDTILAMIDSEQVLGLTGASGALARDQVSMSDMVVLNKIDLVDEERITAVRDWGRRIVPMARILESSFGRVPLDFLFFSQHFSDEEKFSSASKSASPTHSADFFTWSYTTDEALCFGAVKEILYTFPPNILRAKGFIYFAEVPERRGIFQLSGSRVTLSLGEAWGEKKKETQLVFISSEEEIDTMDLELRFESCRVSEVGDGDRGLTVEEIEAWVRMQ